MRSRLLSLLVLASVAALAGCSPPAGQGTRTSSDVVASGAASAAPATSPVSPLADAAAHAEVGKPAPDFTLQDLDGKDVHLAALKGKVVVLEWFNPGCPFVQKSHTVGSLKDAAKKHAGKGVVWLAINSGGPGKQGHGADANREAAKKLAIDHPILVDASGQVGRAYGATNTPHMFVIDDKGTLVYRGAVDNSPDGERESAPGGKVVSYVEEALSAVAAGTSPQTAETKAYGCGVKYAK